MMLCRFNEKSMHTNCKDVYDNHPEYRFRNDLYTAYRDRDVEEYRLNRDEILSWLRFQSSNVLFKNTEHDENFHVIGLVRFINWDHMTNMPLNNNDRNLKELRVPQSKSTTSRTTVHSLPGKPRKDVPILWYGTEDHTSIAQSPTRNESSRLHCNRGRHW